MNFLVWMLLFNVPTSNVMQKYSINDLERITGIKAHTLRIWEKRHELVRPKRTSTNIRYYDDHDLLRLMNISTLNKYGFKISHICKMNEREICEKISDITTSSNGHEPQINALVSSMVQLNEELFEKTFSSSIIKIGFERTIIQIIFPFLEKVGLFWQLGTINSVQEHFVSNLVRQKFIMAISSQNEASSTNAKSFILFLPENEFHELGLLFMAYHVKKNGHKLVYLGQNLPLKDLEETIGASTPDYLFTYFVSAMLPKEIETYLQKLSQNFKGRKILISGYQIRNYDLDLPYNVEFVENSEHFKAFLKTIA